MELLALGAIVLVFIVTINAYEKRVRRLEKELVMLSYVHEDVNASTDLYRRHYGYDWTLPFNVVDSISHRGELVSPDHSAN